MANPEHLKSLDGRYFGRDSDGYMHAFAGIRTPAIKVGPAGSEVAMFGGAAQSALATSTGTQLASAGLITLNSTIAKTYSLAAPQVNVPVTIVSQAATTQTVSLAAAGATILTTLGSSANVITFESAGYSISLMGLTTALFSLISKSTGVGLTTA